MFTLRKSVQLIILDIIKRCRLEGGRPWNKR